MTSQKLNTAQSQLAANDIFTHIAFIGAGNMSKAIIKGLIGSGWPAEKILVTNPTQEKLTNLADCFGVKTSQSNLAALTFAKVLVLAVKPQKLTQVCQQLSEQSIEESLIISIAAGYPCEKLFTALKQSPALVRAMPNTPALIQRGATGLFATPKVNAQQRLLTENLFNAIGTCRWVNDEALMDTITAIAGSSPAYVFLMMQAMVEEAVINGLPQDDALALITQTVAGAAELAALNSNKSLIELRHQVTSKGGTTEAAISSFQTNQFEQIVKKAVAAAINRGKILAIES